MAVIPSAARDLGFFRCQEEPASSSLQLLSIGRVCDPAVVLNSLYSYVLIEAETVLEFAAQGDLQMTTQRRRNTLSAMLLLVCLTLTARSVSAQASSSQSKLSVHC